MKRILYLLFLILLAFSAKVQSQDFSLRLANRTIEVQERTANAELEIEIRGLASYQGYYYGIIQFDKLPNDAEAQLLKSQGIELLNYMPSMAFYAKVSFDFVVSKNSNIRRIVKLSSFDRLRNDLLGIEYPSHAMKNGNLKIEIKPITKSDLGKLAYEIDRNGGKVVSIDEYIHVVTCEIPVTKLKAIAELPFVQFIMPIDAPGEPENYKGKNDHRVNALTRNYTGLSKELDGAGMNVMLQDDGVIGPHIDYQGRIGAQFITINRGNHGDHTGGTIMAAGNLEPRYAGMAPATQLWVYGAAYEGYPGFDSIYTHYAKYDIRITSTSYSNGVNAGYTALAQKLDDQVEKMHDLSHVFSAGNSRSASSNGWYTITGGHKVAKNVITVANLDYKDNDASSSSQGPTKDGRIKPDIGAVGSNVMSTSNPNTYVPKSGTSMSCPGVAGTVTVLYQAFKELNSGNTPDFALMKGIICNTADDLGNKGPDFTNGFGRINARKAYDAIKNKTYFKGTISTGGIQKFSVNVNSNHKLLKVMLIWLDPKGTVGAATPLINDIDVEVSIGSLSPTKPLILDPANPSSIARTGRDSINNLEQVVIENPTKGTYDIAVSGKQIPKGPQEFYVVYILETDDIIVEYPVGGESLVPGEKEMIRWSNAGNSGPYQIEYSVNNGTSWTSIASVNGNSKFYEWTIPSNLTSKALVRVIGSSNTGTSASPFSIFNVPSTPYIDFACPDSIGLKWNAVNGANRYIVYKLGKKYMDSIGTTSSTDYNLLGSCLAYEDGWYAVSARGANGEIGRRSRAYYFDGKLSNCIVQNDIDLLSFNPDLGRVSSCNQSGGVKVGIAVKNNSASPSGNFSLNMKVNNGTLITENVTTPIPAGSTTTIYFSNSVTLNVGNNDILVFQSSSLDQNSCNDSLFTNAEYVDESPHGICDNSGFDNFSNCTTQSNCELESCKLIDGWYNAVNGQEDDIDFRVHNGSTPTRNTGPSYDHTTTSRAGKYLYLEASGGCVMQEAKLISPCFDLSNSINPKLSFWYHMLGSSMGSLELDVFVNDAWKLNIMPKLSGNKGNFWWEQIVDLSLYKGKIVKFRFRGTTGNNFYSDIALDDISVSDTVVADFSTTQNGALVVGFSNLSTTTGISKWNFGDGNTSTQSSPSHTFSKAGFYQVQLIVNSDCGADTITRSIEVILTGVSEYSELLNQVNVFPLPASNFLSIESNILITQVSIIDLSGKEVLINENDFFTQELNIELLESGVYILELKAGDEFTRRKIEILR